MHDKPVNQAFWGVVKCYLVKPTEFGPSLLILKRDKTDSLLQIFKISEELGKYANFTLIDNQILIRYIEVEKTSEEIAELTRLSKSNPDILTEFTEPKAKFSAEQWNNDIIHAPKSGIEIYKNEPEVIEYIQLITSALNGT